MVFPISVNVMKTVVVMFAVLCITTTRGDIDLSDINVSDIQQQLNAELPKINQTSDNVKTLIKDKCIEQAGEAKGKEAYNDIETSTSVLGTCVNDILNYTAIKEEIQEASPKGELDAVFNKYCLKRPEVLGCIENFNSKLTPCLDTEERESQDVFMRIIRSLLNFVCHKGGDQIALFISEKGPECLDAHKDDIQNCINSTLSHYMPAEGIDNLKSLPKLVMGAQQCDDIERLETCIVAKLEKCTEITPANIVESMFRFVKNETICRTAKANKQVAQSGSMTSAGALSLQAIFFIIFVQIVTYLKRRQIVV